MESKDCKTKAYEAGDVDAVATVQYHRRGLQASFTRLG